MAKPVTCNATKLRNRNINGCFATYTSPPSTDGASPQGEAFALKQPQVVWRTRVLIHSKGIGKMFRIVKSNSNNHRLNEWRTIILIHSKGIRKIVWNCQIKFKQPQVEWIWMRMADKLNTNALGIGKMLWNGQTEPEGAPESVCDTLMVKFVRSKRQ